MAAVDSSYIRKYIYNMSQLDIVTHIYNFTYGLDTKIQFKNEPKLNTKIKY